MVYKSDIYLYETPSVFLTTQKPNQESQYLVQQLCIGPVKLERALCCLMHMHTYGRITHVF